MKSMTSVKSALILIAFSLVLNGVSARATRKLAAQAVSVAKVVAKSGSASASTKCSARNGNSANCVAQAVSINGGDAEAVATGDARKGDVDVEAVAVNNDSPGAAVIAKALADGAGSSVAVAIAEGVRNKGEKRTAVIAAIAEVVAESGCKKVQPTLASAFATARQGKYERAFADAFDSDKKVAECLYPACSDDRWHCCKNPKDGKCKDKLESTYTVFKTTPRTIYTCESCKADQYCLCPP